MTPDPQRMTRAEQREHTRTALLDAAAEVFDERGFASASVDDIARRAGFTRGAFYSNFTDKTELAVRMCERRIEAFERSELDDILAADEDDRLAATARALVDNEPPIGVALMLELARLGADDPDVAEVLRRVVDHAVGRVEHLTQAATGAGDHCDPEARRRRAQAIVTAVLGIAAMRQLGVPCDAATVEIVLRGVFTPTEAAASNPDEVHP